MCRIFHTPSPKLLLVPMLLFSLVIIGCKHEYPPFEEYELVGFVPIDSIRYGMLFANEGYLYAMYDTASAYNRWAFLREYDLQDLTNPAQQEIHLLFLPPWLTFRDHQDSLIFFEESYYDLLVLNFKTIVSHTLHLEYHVLDLALKDQFLFASTYDGLRVLDISNLPEYVEVFNDSIYRSGAFLALRDTVLLDIHYSQYGYYLVKFWNVKNPENPQLIYEGELPDVHDLRKGIVFNDQHIILFDYYTISRYRYGMYDTLVYEQMLYLKQNYVEHKASDSLIYLSYGDHIEIIRIDDFNIQQTAFSGDWYYHMMSMEILDETIYVLVRKQGIYVFQRRES